MSLQRKLTISFCIFLATVFIAIMTIMILFGTNEMETRGEENLEVLATQMVQQFDNLMRPMDFITINLISTGNFINSMNSLATIPRDIPRNDFFLNQAALLINSALSNDAIHRGFYGVNVFNAEGDMFTSRILLRGSPLPVESKIERLDDAFVIYAPAGLLLLVPPHADSWTDVGGSQVFSMIRIVEWGMRDIGYIEVQHLATELEQIFTLPDDMGTRALLVSEDGRIFFKSGFETYEQAQDFISGYSGEGFISLDMYTPFTGFTLHLYHDRQMLMAPLVGILQLSGIMMFVFMVFSVIFVYVLNKQFVKPIRNLRDQMEVIEIDSLQDTVSIEAPANDLRALEESFALMRERLSDAIVSKLRSQEMQMQAMFDALQLQINPHFFYNVLHIISQKGAETGDDEISEICTSLASMMRYSTSTLVKSATLEAELEHVDAYVSLMQKRYEGRIEYHGLADDDIRTFEMPKIILLQFVENAINHSFSVGHKTVSVNLDCKRLENGIYIRMTDDGPGFSAQDLDKLNKAIEELDDKILDQNTEFGIGGMGIRNTFFRLWLFYKGDVTFNVGNSPEGGAFVRIEIGGEA